MTISQAASVNLWREAILDRLAVLCMDAPQDEPPASILRRIIAAEVEIALDPSVSDAVPRRTLLQMALDALTNCLSEHGHRCNRCDSEIDEGGKLSAALREALAEPEPEPVAWYYVEDPWGANEWHFMTDSPESQECDPRDWTPLYAAPPAAPAPAAPAMREPLTDEQLARIAVEDEFLLYCDQDSFNEIARAIEAAHGITGGKP